MSIDNLQEKVENIMYPLVAIMLFIFIALSLTLIGVSLYEKLNHEPTTQTNEQPMKQKFICQPVE